MPWEFIDNTAIRVDANVKQLIRRRAARKSNHKKASASHKRDSTCPEKLFLARQIGQGWSFATLPVDVPPASRPFTHKVFSLMNGSYDLPDLYNMMKLDKGTSVLVQYFFMDAAYFHCATALTVARCRSSMSPEEQAAEALHMSQTLSLLSVKISTMERLSDTTLATVLALCQYARVQGREETELLHLKAWKQMVDLRGGIAQLVQDTPDLALKAFRTDLESSLRLGSKLLFPASALSSMIPPLWFQREAIVQENLLKALEKRLPTELYDILKDVLCFARHLNHSFTQRRRITYPELRLALLSIGCRLVELRPLLGPQLGNSLADLVHLGLMAFVVRLFSSAPGESLARGLVSCIEEDVGSDDLSQKVLVWALFIGQTTLKEIAYGPWLVEQTAVVLRRLGVQGFDQLQGILEDLPWIPFIHAKISRELWDKSQRSWLYGGIYPPIGPF